MVFKHLLPPSLPHPPLFSAQPTAPYISNSHKHFIVF